MVGLYYKRREERSQNKSLHLIGKCLLGVAGLVMVGFIFIVFFFNGERIKGPVSIYLGSMLESKVTIGSADFSPLYPYVMRLSDVRFGGTRINELYVEYEIGSLFSSESLNLTDLYINGLTIDEADLNSFKQNRFKHEKIQVQSLRLNHIPLNFKGLSSKDVNLRLTNAVYDDQGLNFTQGTLSALEAELYDEKVTNLSVEFKHSNQGYLLSNLSVNLLGGTVSGMGMFYPSADALTTRKAQDDHEIKAVHPSSEAILADIPAETVSETVPMLAATVPLSAAAAALPRHDAAKISLDDLNFSLIKSAYAEEEAPNHSTHASINNGAKTSTDEPSSAPAAPRAPVAPVNHAAKAALPAQRTDKYQVEPTNTFTVAPSQIENDFAAVGEKLPIPAAEIRKGFRGLVDKRQDPCAYQNLLSTMQPSAGHLDFDELYLTKLVLPRCMLLPGNFAVTAKMATLSDVIITNQTQTGIKTGFADAKKPQQSDPAVQNIAPIDTNAQSAEEQAEAEQNQIHHYGDFVIQGINGHIKDFKLDKGQLLGTYNGTVNEISLPHLMTVFEQNRSSVIFSETGTKFELRGNVYEGRYLVRGEYDKNLTLLTISDLRLANNKLELTQKRWDYLRNGMSTYQIKLGALSFDKLEFLSYINSFPVSVQRISGNAANLKINNPERKRYTSQVPTDLRTSLKENRSHLNPEEALAGEPRSLSDPYSSLSFNIEGNPSALLNLDLTNALYSDLLMRKAQIMLSLSDDILHVSIPKLQFNESDLSAQARIGLVDHNAQSHFELEAKDFEIADFNSNLINHLLTGKVNVNLNLDSRHNGLSQIFKNLEGQIQVNSDALLISDLGIDLINGGPKKDYILTGTELMTAVQGSVAGINNLNLDINFADQNAHAVGRMGLATSNAFFDASFNLQDQANQGSLSLESLAQDSATKVILEGTWNEPIFKISALQRGEPRPGLYLPQYEATAIAKEQTDTILKNFEGPIPPSLQAPVEMAPDSAELSVPSEQNAPAAVPTETAPAEAAESATDSAVPDAAATRETTLAANGRSPASEPSLAPSKQPENATPAKPTSNAADNEQSTSENQPNDTEPATATGDQSGIPDPANSAEESTAPVKPVSAPQQTPPLIDENQAGKSNPAKIYEEHEVQHNATTKLPPSAVQEPKEATDPDMELVEGESFEGDPAQGKSSESITAPAPQAAPAASEPQDTSTQGSTEEASTVEPSTPETKSPEAAPTEQQPDTTGSEANTATITKTDNGTGSADSESSTSTESDASSATETTPQTPHTEETPATANSTVPKEIAATEPVEIPTETTATTPADGTEPEQTPAPTHEATNDSPEPSSASEITAEPAPAPVPSEVPDEANEVLDNQKKAQVTQTVDNPLAPETTQMELKPNDSVHLPASESKPQSEGSNAAAAPSAEQLRQRKQAELEKKADEFEKNLLEQALFDSFFSFKDENGEDAPAAGGALDQDADTADSNTQEVFEFDNQDDEMVF